MSWLSVAVRRLGHQPWLGVVGRRLVSLDRRLLRHARWRFAAPSRLSLPPALLLTTTGRRSGQPRTQPLLYAVDGDGWVVIGSNWGQRHHPAWSLNLLAHPDAEIMIGDETVPVRARLVTGTERDRLWQQLLTIWPAYRSYEQRAGRDLRIFRLVRRQL
jgi:deazaflavin-dependent oxidoreductase (nitroreductase family)